MSKVALGVGYSFNLFRQEDVRHIDFVETSAKVMVNGTVYALHVASTFTESRKVDSLLDNNGEMRINNHKL